MSKAQAIRQHCLECSGDSAKEVTLCLITDCALYPYRFGCGPDTKSYRDRERTAKQNYPEEWKEVEQLRRDRLSSKS
jgi:hypothetical protein